MNSHLQGQYYATPQDAYYGNNVGPFQQPQPPQQPQYSNGGYSPAMYRAPTPNGAPSPASPVHSMYSDYASPGQGQQWSPQHRQASLPAQPLPPANGRTPFQAQDPQQAWFQSLPVAQQQEFVRRQQAQAQQQQAHAHAQAQAQQQAQSQARPPSANGNVGQPPQSHAQRYSNATLPPSAASPAFANAQMANLRATSQTPAPSRPAGSAATFIDPQAFMNKLGEYMQQSGTPIHALPTIESRQIDLPRLFQLVQQLGGSGACVQAKHWEWLASGLGLPSQQGHPPARLQQLQEVYTRYLMPFEHYLKSQQAQRASGEPAAAVPPLAAQMAMQAQQQQQQQQAAFQAQQRQQTPQMEAQQRQQTPQMAPPNRPMKPATPPPIVERVKEEEASPAPKPIALPVLAPSATPAQSTSAIKLESPPKAVPSKTGKRKRQKIEYVPLARPVNSFGGYSSKVLEKVEGVRAKRPARTALDLGTVQMFPIIMSLRSAIPSERVYALNVVNLIAQATRTETFESRLMFDFSSNSDLFEVLVDVLEETAFPEDRPAGRRPRAPRTYREHARLAAERKAKFGGFRKGSAASNVLLPSAVILNIVNTLRTLAISLLPESIPSGALYARNARLIDVLCRLCDFLPDELDQHGQSARSPVHLTFHDLLTIRKDVLCILAEGAAHIQLPSLSKESSNAIFDLILFFLLDPAEDVNPMLETAGTTQANLKLAEQPATTSSAMTLLVCVGGQDTNREVLARTRSIDKLFALWESLLAFIPLDLADFTEAVRYDALFLERLGLALYNTAFIASPEVRLKMRNRTPAIELLLKTIHRLWPSVVKAPAAAFIAQRLAETMLVLASDPNDDKSESVDPNAPFFGGAFESPFATQETRSEAKAPRLTLGRSAELVTDILCRMPLLQDRELYNSLARLFG